MPIHQSTALTIITVCDRGTLRIVRTDRDTAIQRIGRGGVAVDVTAVRGPACLLPHATIEAVVTTPTEIRCG